MVFLFFDGTNFITNQYYQWKKNAEDDKNAIYNNNIRRLEKQIKETKRNEKARYQIREKLLEEKYRHLDTIIHTSHLIYRYQISRKYIEENLRSDHPFKVENGSIAICIKAVCFYEENLPRYADLSFFKDKGALQARRLGAQREYKDTWNSHLKFSLAKRSGPFELWEAYWKTSDSLYEYYSNYLINIDLKRLLKRGVDIDREGVFIGESSPSGKYLFLDHGCCPGVRGLSVITEYGQSIFDTSYIVGVNPNWKNDTLIFFTPGDEKWDKGDNCSKHGLPLYLSEKIYFIDGKIIKTGEKKIFCGQ